MVKSSGSADHNSGTSYPPLPQFSSEDEDNGNLPLGCLSTYPKGA